MRKLGAAYEETRATIVDLVAGLKGDEVLSPVPACPGWSVHDVIAHLAGICADISTGNIQRAPTVAWTAAQLETRKNVGIDEILDEWDELGPQIAQVIDDFPGHYGAQAVADISVHEHDLRGAMESPGNRDSRPVAIGLEYLTNILLHPCMTAVGIGPLHIRAGNESWVLGAGGSATGDPDSAWLEALLSTDGRPIDGLEPVGALTLDRFEFFRAITGRRAESQIRGFHWSVDPEPYLPMFAFGPFTVRETELVE